MWIKYKLYFYKQIAELDKKLESSQKLNKRENPGKW